MDDVQTPMKIASTAEISGITPMDHFLSRSKYLMPQRHPPSLIMLLASCGMVCGEGGFLLTPTRDYALKPEGLVPWIATCKSYEWPSKSSSPSLQLPDLQQQMP